MSSQLQKNQGSRTTSVNTPSTGLQIYTIFCFSQSVLATFLVASCSFKYFKILWTEIILRSVLFAFRGAEAESFSRWGHVCKRHETCPTFTARLVGQIWQAFIYKIGLRKTQYSLNSQLSWPIGLSVELKKLRIQKRDH